VGVVSPAAAEAEEAAAAGKNRPSQNRKSINFSVKHRLPVSDIIR